MLPEIEEMKAKVNPVTVGLVIIAVAAGTILGINYNEIYNQGKASVTLHEFAKDEISGLRSDMVKEDLHINEDIDELKNDIN